MDFPREHFELLEAIEKLPVNEETKVAMLEGKLKQNVTVYNSVEEFLQKLYTGADDE